MNKGSNQEKTADKNKSDGSIWRAYVDGSYSERCPTCISYGVVIISPDNKYRGSACIEKKELSKLKSVGAEIYGACVAAQWAYKQGCKKLIIYHDYIGISEWVMGYWQAKAGSTITYRDFIRRLQRKMYITFKHIKAHSGNFYNEMVDKISKEELVRKVAENVRNNNVKYDRNLRRIQEENDRRFWAQLEDEQGEFENKNKGERRFI